MKALKLYAICFYCIPIWGSAKDIKTKLQTTCSYLILSFFKKQNEFFNLSLCLIFNIIFKEKYFSWYTLLLNPVLLPGCIDFVRYRKIVYCKCLLTRLWRHKFGIYPYLSNQAVFLRMKGVFKIKKKNFSLLLKGFQWNK